MGKNIEYGNMNKVLIDHNNDHTQQMVPWFKSTQTHILQEFYV